MNTSRKGKIARLPKALREQLNTCIDNGHSGHQILTWLNADPAVKEILNQSFAGRPITKQNLSEWRCGGYQDWVKLQEQQSLTLKILEQNDILAAGIDPAKVVATYATIAAVDYIQSTQARLKRFTDEDKRCDYLSEIQDQLLRLRREDCRAAHLKLRQEKWTRQLETEKAVSTQAAFTEERRQMLAYFQLKPELKDMSQKMGGDAKAWDHAAFLLELQHNLKIGLLERKGPFPPPPQTPDARPQTLAHTQSRPTCHPGQPFTESFRHPSPTLVAPENHEKMPIIQASPNTSG